MLTRNYNDFVREFVTVADAMNRAIDGRPYDYARNGGSAEAAGPRSFAKRLTSAVNRRSTLPCRASLWNALAPCPCLRILRSASSGALITIVRAASSVALNRASTAERQRSRCTASRAVSKNSREAISSSRRRVALYRKSNDTVHPRP